MRPAPRPGYTGYGDEDDLPLWPLSGSHDDWSAAEAEGGREAENRPVWPWLVLLAATLGALWFYFKEEVPGPRAILGLAGTAPPGAAGSVRPGTAGSANGGTWAGPAAPAPLQPDVIGPGRAALTFPGPVQVEVAAVGGEGWVGLWAGGQQLADLTLEPGDLYSVRVKHAVRIQVRNPGALRLQVDGRPVPLSGEGPFTLEVQVRP